MWLRWYPPASSEGTLKSFQARRHAYACSMLLRSGVSSPRQIHTAVPDAGPLFSCNRDKETNFSCYLVFPSTDKDQKLNWFKSEIHHLRDVALLQSRKQEVARVCVKTNGANLKVNYHPQALVGWNTLWSSLGIHTFLEQHCVLQTSQKRKKSSQQRQVLMRRYDKEVRKEIMPSMAFRD